MRQDPGYGRGLWFTSADDKPPVRFQTILESVECLKVGGKRTLLARQTCVWSWQC